MWVYDLSSRWRRGCPSGEVEDVAELVLGRGCFGEYPAGFGSASGGGVDQDGCFDSGEVFKKFPDGEVQSGVFGFAAHQVGDLQV